MINTLSFLNSFEVPLLNTVVYYFPSSKSHLIESLQWVIMLIREFVPWSCGIFFVVLLVFHESL